MSDPGSTPQGEETPSSNVPTPVSKLTAIAVGLMLTAATVFVVFLGWAAIFWALSYLVGRR
jgi:hypothetical protein